MEAAPHDFGGNRAAAIRDPRRPSNNSDWRWSTAKKQTAGKGDNQQSYLPFTGSCPLNRVSGNFTLYCLGRIIPNSLIICVLLCTLSPPPCTFSFSVCQDF